MKLRFIKKKEEVDGVWSFFFEPLERPEWVAGQSIRLELPRPTFGVDEKRFTISAAPFEKNIRVTTRLSDSTFKRSLAALGQGDLVDAFSIEGDFIWNEQPKLFLAGGIGVTPFRSMLAQAAHEGQSLNTILIHSSHGGRSVFKSEFDKLAKKDGNFKPNYLKERIRLEDLEQIPDWKNRLVYISGPEKMVNELSKKIISAGLSQTQLKRDLFTGNLFL